MKIVLTPDWFLGTDVVIEVISFLVLVLFFLLARKNYKLTGNKNSKYLGIGFLLIAIAEIATILTKFVLYYDTTLTQSIGCMAISYNIVKSVDIFYYTGFFLHKFLTLLGLYVIYKIPHNKEISGDMFLVACFFLISAVLSSTSYYVFHILALILLVMIIDNYLDVYKKNKSQNTKILIAAFIILGLSQVIFILSAMPALYAIAQILQLVSYLILLSLIIRILQYGKKKKQVRNNI